jgi:Tfp pilus assembly protein PilZ
MELRLSGVGDFLKIWKKDFLGQQGFFIPGDKNFALGQEFTLSISIDGESWGSAQVLPVWSNQFGPVSADTPRGTFLRLIRAEKNLQQKIGSVSP